MHPNPLFRSDDRAALEALIADTGFGMVFAATPDGPRVAHVPLLSDGEGHIRFHLARSNALTKHLANGTALIVVNGPDGYISPRWYDDRNTVPTWDYVALEMEGPVARLEDDALEDLLHAVITKFESGIDGEPWLASETGEELWAGLFKGIAGFELTVEHWRPTFKLSQKRAPRELARISEGLAAAGNPALAACYRGQHA